MIGFIKRYFKNKNKFYTGSLVPSYTNWNIIEPHRLYLNSVSCAEREEFSKLLTEKTIFHSYWYGSFGAKQAFSIKSLLCTQDPDNTEVWLWLDEQNGYSEMNENKYLQELQGKIKVLPWNTKREISNTPFQKIKTFINSGKPLAAKGDDFRIITLSKYGGVYFNLDIMFLKDFTLLLKGHEFVYAWEYQPYANSALLYLRKNSYITNYLTRKFLKRKEAMPWVLFDYKDKNLANLRNYPCVYFDPLWGGYTPDMPFEEFSDFFREFGNDFHKAVQINSYKDFFLGAFAYHWHNRWDAPEYDNSYFGIFQQEFDKILSKQE